MRIKIILLSSVLLMLIGCSDTDNQSGTRDQAQDINQSRHDTSDSHIQESRNNRQDDQNRSNMGNSKNNDIFTNDLSIRMEEELTNRRDIRRAQVAITKTRALISVQLSNHADRDGILDSIENEIKHMVPKKEIVIYTDDSYYDRMKDLGSRLNRLTDDDDIDDYIDEHFNK